MKILTFPILKGKNLRQSVILVVIIVGLIGLGVAGYFITKNWQAFSENFKKISVKTEIFKKLPAGLPFFEKKEKKITEEKVSSNEPEKAEEKPGKYIEKAEKGEGTTHLARRALRKYLQENKPNFELTPEHKIYIEDYLAKKINKPMLKLGQEIEFSQDLIKEAIQKAETLTPEQLQNLEQYSQLVPSLNY